MAVPINWFDKIFIKSYYLSDMVSIIKKQLDLLLGLKRLCFNVVGA
jgi:hypothetical protein